VKQRLILLIKRLHDITWKKIYWPDYACLWFLPAYKKANMLLQHHNVKNLISVSLPFTGHLVGYFIKKKNLKTTWVVDIIDPSFFPDLSCTNTFLLYSKLNRSVEKRVFRNAQTVSVLTQSIQKRYSKLHPESRHKIAVNPNLLHHERDTKSSLFPENKKIRLVFIGTLYKTTRSPEHLLQVFEMLLQTEIAERLELHFFGGIDYCVEQFMSYQELMSKRIFIHGKVSREKAIRAMYSADILVNIGNSNPYQEPSKVIEYASIGKPIINIMTIHNDSSALVLEKYPAAMNVFCPMMERKTEQLDKLIKFIENPPYVEKDFLEKLIMPYTIDTVANTYLQMLDKGGI
jgi:glycosyltransferase involved in cell wall biosynthesis